MTAPRMVTLKRAGQPPLRFKGAEDSRRSIALPDGRRITITLWLRTAGGFVVAITREADGTREEDAYRSATIEAAMEFVEDHCSRTPKLAQKSKPLPLTKSVDLLLSRQAERSSRQAAEMLVGDVFDDWARRFTSC